MNKKGIAGFINLSLLLQILIFSQPLLSAMAFGLSTHSELNAIYGFMIGLVSTTIVALYQCQKVSCMKKTRS